MMNNDDHQLSKILFQLKSPGALLVKQKINGNQYSRDFFLHEHDDYITYRKSSKLFGKPRTYHITDINEISPGFRTETFYRLSENGHIKKTDEHRVFSIMFHGRRRELHLVAPDNDVRDLWVQGLEYLKIQYSQKTQGELIRDEKWISTFFHIADKDKSKLLTIEECRSLLTKSFHVQLNHHTLQNMFKEAAKSKKDVLKEKEFIKFFRLLTRRQDLYEIMQQYAKDGFRRSIDTIYMDKEELAQFLNIKPERIQTLIDRFETDDDLRKKSRLGIDGFRNLLLSKDYNILNPAYTGQVYQDMTRPLYDYYINTSHNTYLFYSQVAGAANPEAYNSVLLMGCRAIEFDCYDGPHGEPIVKHAHTLVTACTFKSIVRAIEPNLFKTSPYPVIFNIENHCSLEQQRQMARILKSILGEQLITEPLPNKDPTILPSPEDLKRKVLVRSKQISTITKIIHGDDEGSMINPLSKEVDPELSDLFVYLRNVQYGDCDYAKTHYTSFHSTSLAEYDFLKHAQQDPIGLLSQTNWRLFRIYPDGLRQDSSNQNPVYGWNSGVQLVALNFQNHDDMMSLNHGKFLDNGGCGYILKPDYLFNVEKTKFNPWLYPNNFDQSIKLTIKIISGQFLPKSHRKTSDIPDTYVRLSTHGLTCDDSTHQTKIINNNAFNPIWKETFSFHIKYPKLCLIYIAVFDHDVVTYDDRLAYFSAPISLIQPGYRHIQLRSNDNKPIFSTLFVHVDIQDDSDEHILSTKL